MRSILHWLVVAALVLVSSTSEARWLSVDPVEANANNGQNFNRYYYANNNPYRFTDPDGRQSREFNLENQRLGIKPPPRSEKDWLGPVIGKALMGVVAAPAAGFGYGYAFANPVAANNIIVTLGEIAGVTGAARYGPLNPGPLAQEISSTFRGGSYTARTLESNTTLYRAISDSGNPTGSYWTSVKPQGPLQSVIDSALDQNWGNTATRVITADIPAGTRVYEGAAAAQRGLVGGGNQIYIPKVDEKWIRKP